ncbi:hypothetical protein LUZ61_014303 [Rhynchospora tenuis]|uniref:HMA domain-containing protein n=1 Tax=Rhynchospora tenuis TaxID=198213 RepID=A0AAD5WB59_9POAL|nr:hypothetical protein LUZ61_014303 [Rhynchospora tenuis]
MTTVEMCVHMDCDGCQSKVRKSLEKIRGVDNIDIDMQSQKVTVTGSIDQKKILKAVRRTGRRAVLWPYPLNTQVQTQLLYQQNHPALAQTNYMGFNGNPASSYNYYKHGYDDSHLHYGYNNNAGHSAVAGERTGDVFSDENPNACSVM